VQKRSKAELSQLLIAFMLVVCLAVIGAGGDIIRLLADARFREAAAIVPWLAVGVLCYGVMHVGNAQLILLGKLHWAAWFWGVALIVSLGLNLWLVPIYGGLGAALTQAATFTLIMLLVWGAVLHFEYIPMHWNRLVVGVVVAGVGGFAMCEPWSGSPGLSLLYKLPVGTLLAAICVQILAPAFLRRALKRV
jgi:O-antigen/teichoic acid export membrane protein